MKAILILLAAAGAATLPAPAQESPSPAPAGASVESQAALGTFLRDTIADERGRALASLFDGGAQDADPVASALAALARFEGEAPQAQPAPAVPATPATPVAPTPAVAPRAVPTPSTPVTPAIAVVPAPRAPRVPLATGHGGSTGGGVGRARVRSDDEVRELKRRIAELERKLAALHGAPEPPPAPEPPRRALRFAPPRGDVLLEKEGKVLFDSKDGGRYELRAGGPIVLKRDGERFEIVGGEGGEHVIELRSEGDGETRVYRIRGGDGEPHELHFGAPPKAPKAPKAPRAPKAPKAPKSGVYTWSGDPQPDAPRGLRWTTVAPAPTASGGDGCTVHVQVDVHGAHDGDVKVFEWKSDDGGEHDVRVEKKGDYFFAPDFPGEGKGRYSFEWRDDAGGDHDVKFFSGEGGNVFFSPDGDGKKQVWVVGPGGADELLELHGGHAEKLHEHLSQLHGEHAEKLHEHLSQLHGEHAEKLHEHLSQLDGEHAEKLHEHLSQLDGEHFEKLHEHLGDLGFEPTGDLRIELKGLEGLRALEGLDLDGLEGLKELRIDGLDGLKELEGLKGLQGLRIHVGDEDPEILEEVELGDDELEEVLEDVRRELRDARVVDEVAERSETPEAPESPDSTVAELHALLREMRTEIESLRSSLRELRGDLRARRGGER